MWVRRCLVYNSSCRNRLGFFLRWMSGGSNTIAALWGNGDYGRLGLGNLNSQWKPALVTAMNDENACAIACGGSHTLFLTDKSRVYATGLNNFGQLGISSEENHVLKPYLVSSLPDTVVSISAGYHHSAAITLDGELYMWGNNSSGQLGLGRKARKIISTPRKVEYLVDFHVKMVALGSEHSIAISDKGDVFSWGAGGSGRLGHGHESSILGFLKTSSESIPRMIKMFEGLKVIKVAAGMLHSACIDEKGFVFTFGERTHKFDFGSTKNVSLPSSFSGLPYVQNVACGAYHTCVVTNRGELFSWGSNENGCLGLGCSDVISSPEKVEGRLSNLSVSEVSCGWKHTAAISGGDVFTWGWGGSHGTFSEDGHSSGGQLGHGNDVDYFEPAKVNFGKNLKALQVSCGFNHTGAILEYL